MSLDNETGKLFNRDLHTVHTKFSSPGPNGILITPDITSLEPYQHSESVLHL